MVAVILSGSMNETPPPGMERGGGAWVPYGGPLVEMDALIGVKCILCLGPGQRKSAEPNKVLLTHELHMAQRGSTGTKQPPHPIYTPPTNNKK